MADVEGTTGGSGDLDTRGDHSFLAVATCCQQEGQPGRAPNCNPLQETRNMNVHFKGLAAHPLFPEGLSGTRAPWPQPASQEGLPRNQSQRHQQDVGVCLAAAGVDGPGLPGHLGISSVPLFSRSLPHSLIPLFRMYVWSAPHSRYWPGHRGERSWGLRAMGFPCR